MNEDEQETRRFWFWMFLAGAILVGLAKVAGAAEPAHKIDMTVVLDGEDGKPAPDVFSKKPLSADVIAAAAKASAPPATFDPDPACEKCDRLTLGHAAAHALVTAEKDVDAEQLFARARLAERIKDAKDAELTDGERSVIKKALAKMYGPIMLLRAYPVIDPTAKPAEVK